MPPFVPAERVDAQLMLKYDIGVKIGRKSNLWTETHDVLRPYPDSRRAKEGGSGSSRTVEIVPKSRT